MTCDWSGGADSRSVALSASRAVRASEADPLTVMTYLGTGGEADPEFIRAHRQVARFPWLRHRVVSHGRGFFADLSAVPATDRPFDLAYAYGRTADVFGAARSTGSLVHLSGDGGDSVLTAPPAVLIDALSRRSWSSAVSGARRFRRLHQAGLAGVIAAAYRVGRTGYEEYLGSVVNALRSSTQPPSAVSSCGLGWAIPPRPPSWVTPEAVDLLADELESLRPAARPFGPSVSASLAVLAGTAAAAAPYREIAATLGVDLQFPFLDDAVVDECLTWDEGRRPPDPDSKPMLDGLHRRFGIPRSDWVVPKHTSGHARDFVVGLRRNLGNVKSLFRESRLAERKLIDLARWFEALDLAAAGAGGSPAAIARTTAGELWMQRNELS